MSVVETTSATGRLEKAVGAEHFFASGTRIAEYAVDGIAPKMAVQPENAEQAAEIVRTAVE
jgi:hypothetical protein